MSFRIMLAGGGSGGHVYPLVAIAEELKRQAPSKGKDITMVFIGDGDLIKNTAKELGVPFMYCMAPKWRRYASIKNILDLAKMPIGLIQAVFRVWTFMPDVLLLKGGYASFLPALAAKIMAVPIIIHESDSVPGKVNLWWGNMSQRVFVGFEHTRQYFKPEKTEVVGNPMRTSVIAKTDRITALANFGFSGNKPVIFISGGSQGAQKINEVIFVSLTELVEKYSIILQCGDANYPALVEQMHTIIKENAGYASLVQDEFRMFGSLDELKMGNAFNASDVVISRAGSAIFEIAALGKPCILIPLQGSAQNHQLLNAKEFEESGAFILEQENVTPHLLQQAIEKVYQEREERSQKILQFAKPNAAIRIAEELLSV